MAAGNPHPAFIKLLDDDYVRKERARFESKIVSWATGIIDAAEDFSR